MGTADKFVSICNLTCHLVFALETKAEYSPLSDIALTSCKQEYIIKINQQPLTYFGSWKNIDGDMK